MIRFEGVTITYPGASRPVLRDVHLHVPEGELCLVVGRTGSGKSTLLRAVNGLVPHFTGGLLSGRVLVDGRDTRTHPPRELADVVGVVGQDPPATFVADTVEDELAYAMESLGVAPDVMRRRVEETLDLLGLTAIRGRDLSTLSGGQAQRVAIGAVLTAHPRVLVLDEPTSALDPPAAEEVLAALQRLVHDLGVTVLMAEHRLERVVHYADRVVHVIGDGRIEVGDPAALMRTSPVAPPVVALGRLARWDPLPLSVRDARRAATDLRERLHLAAPPQVRVVGERRVAEVAAASVRRGSTQALQRVSFHAAAGEVVALMGRNGAGKSTLLGCLAGVHTPTTGTVMVAGIAPTQLKGRALVRSVGLVPQEPGDLLYAETVGGECAGADKDAGLAPGTTAGVLRELAAEVEPTTHPRDLSEGQRLLLALAVVLAPQPSLLLLDEPTRGLDYAAKARLGAILLAQAAAGRSVVLATHDVEVVADVADRVVILADGEVVADGPTREVVVASPAFAPQVAKILAPVPLLTVAQVEAALEERAG